MYLFFFFKQKTAYYIRISDWSSDVCSSDLDGITAHLREDRRHIRDSDIERLMGEIHLPLNLEMAATEGMLAIALRHKPHAVCIVPERREEVTTEEIGRATCRERVCAYV